jgi:putative flippase GtrA
MPKSATGLHSSPGPPSPVVVTSLRRQAGRLPPGLFRRLLRYAGVSALSTTLSLAVLAVLVATSTTSAGWANVIATGIGTGPSFELNRRWVWGKQGKRSLAGEVGPFWALSFIGLALSTLAVSFSAGWADSARVGATGRALVAIGASIATFGLLWIFQYVMLDRILFHRVAESPNRLHNRT